MKFIFFFLTTFISLSSRDFAEVREDNIQTFILYNYDSMIEECFLENRPYLQRLSELLTSNTKEAEYLFVLMKENPTLCFIDNPPHFLYKINEILKNSNIHKSFVDQ